MSDNAKVLSDIAKVLCLCRWKYLNRGVKGRQVPWPRYLQKGRWKYLHRRVEGRVTASNSNVTVTSIGDCFLNSCRSLIVDELLRSVVGLLRAVVLSAE